MPNDWIVVLEAAVDGSQSVGTADVEHLLVCLTDWYPSALHAEDRYAVQLAVAAATPDLALTTGLDLWRRAALQAGLPRCPVVRAEVKIAGEWAPTAQKRPGHSRAMSSAPKPPIEVPPIATRCGSAP